MLRPKNYLINYLPAFLSITFFLCAQFAVAQTISGSVIGVADPLNGAIIKNTTARKVTLSDLKGNFKISAAKGDTLIVSFYNYKTDTLMVNGQTFFTITLQPLIQLLSEVLIKSNRLSPLAQLKKNQQNYKQIYRIGDNSRLLSTSGDYQHIGVGLSIDALYSTFSKEGKDARHLQHVFVNQYYNDIVDNRFNKSLVSKITGYQGRQLEDFMADNRPTYEFIQLATDYDLIQYIQRRTQGVVLQTDNPMPKKTEDRRFKIKYKMPVTKSATGLGIR